MTYNGLPALLSYNKTKVGSNLYFVIPRHRIFQIASKEWRDWIELPTNHLVIAFDSDGTISELSGGFRLVYQMVDRYFVPNEVREEIVNLKETEELLLNKIFTPGTDKDDSYWLTEICDHPSDKQIEKPKNIEF